MGKKDSSIKKPKPPNREQIMADMASASVNDVVFTQQYDIIDISEGSSTNEESNGKSLGEESSINEEIEETYKKASRLIETHNKLMKEPECLNEMYDNLNKLGQDISSSIEDLKSAAETVMLQAGKKKKL
ncbi:hypothetical protein ACF0H5_013949 [Mactra antiquata]